MHVLKICRCVHTNCEILPTCALFQHFLQILKNLLAHFNAEETRLQEADHEC